MHQTTKVEKKKQITVHLFQWKIKHSTNMQEVMQNVQEET